MRSEWQCAFILKNQSRTLHHICMYAVNSLLVPVSCFGFVAIRVGLLRFSIRRENQKPDSLRSSDECTSDEMKECSDARNQLWAFVVCAFFALAVSLSPSLALFRTLLFDMHFTIGWAKRKMQLKLEKYFEYFTINSYSLLLVLSNDDPLFFLHLEQFICQSNEMRWAKSTWMRTLMYLYICEHFSRVQVFSKPHNNTSTKKKTKQKHSNSNN